MNSKKYILPLVFAALLTCIGGTAGGVLDDVYYWSDADTRQEIVPEEALPVEEQPAPRVVEITFLDDSVTLRSDTVVRAVIRRR